MTRAKAFAVAAVATVPIAAATVVQAMGKGDVLPTVIGPALIAACIVAWLGH
jgi:hypothetical protein